MPLTNSSVESTQLRKQSMNLKQVNEYKSPKQAQKGKRMKKRQQKQSEESIQSEESYTLIYVQLQFYEEKRMRTE